MTTTKHIFLIGLCLSAFALCGAHAQINFDGTQYTQNFDSLGTADAKWKNNSTIPGWYAGTVKPSSPNIFKLQADAAQEGFMNLGSSEDTDRSFGGRIQYFSFGYAVQFINQTDKTLTEFHVGYTGEQWTDSNKGQAIHVYYKLNDPEFGLKTEANKYTLLPEYIVIPALTFEHPVGTGAGVLLDGRKDSNKSILTATVSDISWEPGKSLWIYWFDRDNGGPDQAFGINDFSFTASASASK